MLPEWGEVWRAHGPLDAHARSWALMSITSCRTQVGVRAGGGGCTMLRRAGRAGRRACSSRGGPAPSEVLPPVFDAAAAGVQEQRGSGEHVPGIYETLAVTPMSEDAAAAATAAATTVFESARLDKPMKFARAVYGGQFLGQAIIAAARTITQGDLKLHSLHAYFLRPGVPDAPAAYRVGHTRDGRSFANREVKAYQKEKAVFSMQMSFHKREESVLDHQATMPEGVPPPDALHSRATYLDEVAAAGCGEKATAVGHVRNSGYDSMTPAVEVRYVDARDAGWWTPLATQAPRAAHLRQWVRCRETLVAAQSVHAAVLAYASDAGIILPALLPHGNATHKIAMITSLDHSMWFHSAFRADEWLLLDLRCRRAAEGRALITGNIFTQDGVLCATMAQEALIRLAPKKETAKAA